MSAGGSIGIQSSQSLPWDMTPNAFRGIRGPLAQQLQNIFRTGGPQYQGEFAAPLGQGEQNAIGQINNQAFNPSGAGAASDDMLARTIRGEFADPSQNPFLQGTIDAAVRPIMTNFMDQELLDRSGFTQGGHKVQASSPFGQARARAIEGTANAVGDVGKQIAYQNQQAERQRQMEAVAQAGGRLQSSMQALQANALPRLVAQLGIDGGLAEFQRRMGMMMSALQLGSGVAGPHIGQLSESRSFGAGGQAGT